VEGELRIGFALDEIKKRIYNPVTKKYYAVRQKTTKKGRRG